MKSNAKNTCADILKQRILSMQITPGELLDEVELSQEFGISRTPLREVIQRLCGEGYLISRKNRGALVAPMDMATLRHFFQAAPMIYASIGRLAAENATSDDVETLKDIQIQYRKSIDDAEPAATAMLNHQFHEQIGAIASSAYLIPSLKRLLIDHTRIGQVFYRATSTDEKEKIARAADQHDQMIEAFQNNVPTQAVELTLEHWELSRGQIEQFVAPAPLDFDLNLNSQSNKRENNRAI